MTYDVRRVVLGGGVAGAGDTFLRPVLGALDELRARPSSPARRSQPTSSISCPRTPMPAHGEP